MKNKGLLVTALVLGVLVVIVYNWHIKRVRDAGIGVQVHYMPVHLQPYFREHFGTRAGDFPRAELYYEQALSLPLFPAMDDADVDRVVDALLRALSAHGAEGSAA